MAKRSHGHLALFISMHSHSRFSLVSAPMAPEKVSLLEVNSTYVVLHLLSWKTRGCAIQRFVIKYKESGTNDWLLVSNNVLSTLDLFHIYGLHPATWYSLNVNAISDAGNTGTTSLSTSLSTDHTCYNKCSGTSQHQNINSPAML